MVLDFVEKDIKFTLFIVLHDFQELFQHCLQWHAKIDRGIERRIEDGFGIGVPIDEKLYGLKGLSKSSGVAKNTLRRYLEYLEAAGRLGIR